MFRRGQQPGERREGPGGWLAGLPSGLPWKALLPGHVLSARPVVPGELLSDCYKPISLDKGPAGGWLQF